METDRAFEVIVVFLDAHRGCPDHPNYTRFHVWLPRESAQCTVTVTCICGARTVVEAPPIVGQAIVETCEWNGIPMTQSDAAQPSSG
jgi:hypothetical protein